MKISYLPDRFRILRPNIDFHRVHQNTCIFRRYTLPCHCRSFHWPINKSQCWSGTHRLFLQNMNVKQSYLRRIVHLQNTRPSGCTDALSTITLSVIGANLAIVSRAVKVVALAEFSGDLFFGILKCSSKFYLSFFKLPISGNIRSDRNCRHHDPRKSRTRSF